MSDLLANELSGNDDAYIEERLLGVDVDFWFDLLSESLHLEVLKMYLDVILESEDEEKIIESVVERVIEKVEVVASVGDSSEPISERKYVEGEILFLRPGGVYEFLTNFQGSRLEVYNIDEIILVMDGFPIDKFTASDRLKIAEYLNGVVNVLEFANDEAKDKLFTYLNKSFGCDFDLEADAGIGKFTLEDVDCISGVVLSPRRLKRFIGLFPEGVVVQKSSTGTSHIRYEFFGRVNVNFSGSSLSCDKVYLDHLFENLLYLNYETTLEPILVEYSEEEYNILMDVFQKYNDKYRVEVFKFNTQDGIERVS